MRALLLKEGELLQLEADEWKGVPCVRVNLKTNDMGDIEVSAYVDIETMRPLARIESFGDG